MRKNPRRILSPQRLPFRHPGRADKKSSMGRRRAQFKSLAAPRGSAFFFGLLLGTARPTSELKPCSLTGHYRPSRANALPLSVSYLGARQSSGRPEGSTSYSDERRRSLPGLRMNLSANEIEAVKSSNPLGTKAPPEIRCKV